MESKRKMAELNLRYGAGEEALAEQLWTENGEINVSVLEIFSEVAPDGFEEDFIYDMLELIADMTEDGASKFEIARTILREIRDYDFEEERDAVNNDDTTAFMTFDYPTSDDSDQRHNFETSFRICLPGGSFEQRNFGMSKLDELSMDQCLSAFAQWHKSNSIVREHLLNNNFRARLINTGSQNGWHILPRFYRNETESVNNSRLSQQGISVLILRQADEVYKQVNHVPLFSLLTDIVIQEPGNQSLIKNTEDKDWKECVKGISNDRKSSPSTAWDEIEDHDSERFEPI